MGGRPAADDAIVSESRRGVLHCAAERLVARWIELLHLRPEGRCAQRRDEMVGAAEHDSDLVTAEHDVSKPHSAHLFPQQLAVGEPPRPVSIAGGIVWAWVLTIPASALIAAVAWWLGQLVL